MNTTSMVLARPEEMHFQVINRRGSARPSRIRAVTRDLRAMTQAIQLHWNEAPPEVQAAFRELANFIVDPPPLRFIDRVRFTLMSLLAGPDDVRELHEVLLTLQNTLQAIIARENRAIAQVLADPEICASMATGWKEDGDALSLQDVLERLG